MPQMNEYGEKEKVRMNGNAWTVTDANGIAHQLGCAVKTFGGPEITVDGNTYKVKSSNFLVNVVDYSVDFPGVNCHIVMVGKKARLVVNGVYDDDKTPYEPVASIPAWVWVMVVFSIIGGWLICGLLCGVIGIAMSTVYITAALQRNTKKIIGAFVIYLVIFAGFFALGFWLGASGALG